MKRITIDLFDALEDGLPTDETGAVNFICDGDVFTGWPLLAENVEDGDYMTREEAKDDPMEVIWEVSEGAMQCLSVRYWFKRFPIPNTPAQGK